MNIKFLLVALVAVLTIQAFPTNVSAQGQYNEINYRIPSASYQAEGRSTQLSASLEYDDTTHVLESLEMEVPLFSFLNRYGGSVNYIAAYGGAASFPWMRFESSKIEEKGDKVEMRGTLYFRGEYRPVTITATREEDKGTLNLYGDFTLNLRDYFLFTPTNYRVPPFIDLSFNLVFDLSTPEEG